MRCTSSSGRNSSWSTPTGTTCMRSRGTPWSVWMSSNEFCDTVMTRVIREATRVCILVNPYQRALEKRCQVRLGVLHLEAAVDGDRVVDGGQDGQAHALHGQQAVAQALVVLHQVEVVDPVAQVLGGPHAEGQRLGEGAAHEGADLDPVADRLELPHARHPHGEVVVVDVEAGQLVQRDAGRRAPGRAGPRAPRRGGPDRPAPWSGAGCRRPGRPRGACRGRSGRRCSGARRHGSMQPPSRPLAGRGGWAIGGRIRAQVS